MADSRLEDIFLFLKSKGVEVYFPVQHTGECLTKYVVVKAASQIPFFSYSTDYNVYELLLYVPQDQYSSLETFMDTIKGYMRELKAQLMIRPSRYQTIPYYESDIRGYMVSIEYKLYKKTVA
jgi:hypothetical protein